MRPASSRTELAAAVRAARLSPTGKLVLFGLGAAFDDEDPGPVAASLSDIAAWTGLHRATVKRWLRKLDGAWLHRQRPDLAAARRLHITTSYVLLVPGELGAGSAGARRSGQPQLGAASARTTEEDDSSSAWIALAAVVTEELAAAGRTVTGAQAAEIARRILSGVVIRTSPERYLRAALQRSAAHWAPATARPAHPPVPAAAPSRLTREEIQAITRGRYGLKGKTG